MVVTLWRPRTEVLVVVFWNDQIAEVGNTAVAQDDDWYKSVEGGDESSEAGEEGGEWEDVSRVLERALQEEWSLHDSKV